MDNITTPFDVFKEWQTAQNKELSNATLECLKVMDENTRILDMKGRLMNRHIDAIERLVSRLNSVVIVSGVVNTLLLLAIIIMAMVATKL